LYLYCLDGPFGRIRAGFTRCHNPTDGGIAGRVRTFLEGATFSSKNIEHFP
jgi:hypothetical protein